MPADRDRSDDANRHDAVLAESELADAELTDAGLARRVASLAGRELLRLRADPEVDDVRAAGDRTAHEFITARLAAARPDDAVLSEEGADDPVRLTADRVWIVDPLDGTREYGEPGRVDWAVHIALWERRAAEWGGTLTAGAVALPARGVTLATDSPPPISTGSGERRRLRVVTSRTRTPAEIVAAIEEDLGAERIPLGSAGAKAAAVLMGEADAYVHTGGQYEWDSAAPVAVARAAGLVACRLDGSELTYNRPNVWLPDLFIAHPDIADEVLTAVRRRLRDQADS